MFSSMKSMIKTLRKTANTLFKSGRNMKCDLQVSSNIDWTRQNVFFNEPSEETAKYDGTTYSTKIVKDERIEKKPVEIWQDLMSEIPKIDLVDLDKKIKVVKKRKEFLTEHMNVGAQDEKYALSILQARKKFPKYAHEFKWAVTNMEKINELCKKYKVQMVDFYGYYKSIPNEAIDELEKFCEVYAKITKEKPVLKLIVDVGGPEQKKDPILLACSPFGKWFYILGAWDKEVEFVDELVYGNK